MHITEHEVGPPDLPRGPSLVERRIADTWQRKWLHSATDVGGEAYGLKFRHNDGRNGWALWLRGKFHSSYVYPHPGAMVPQRYSATELKEVLSG